VFPNVTYITTVDEDAPPGDFAHLNLLFIPHYCLTYVVLACLQTPIDQSLYLSNQCIYYAMTFTEESFRRAPLQLRQYTIRLLCVVLTYNSYSCAIFYFCKTLKYLISIAVVLSNEHDDISGHQVVMSIKQHTTDSIESALKNVLRSLAFYIHV